MKQIRKAILRSKFTRWEIVERDGICFFEKEAFWRKFDWTNGSEATSKEDISERFSERISLDQVIEDLSGSHILVNLQEL